MPDSKGKCCGSKNKYYISWQCPFQGESQMSADIDGISTMIIFDDCWMWLDDVGQQAGREFAIFF